jgi:DNA ligase 1
MKFSKLAQYLAQLEANSSRLKITEILANLFKEADEKEIHEICYLVLGQLAPHFMGIDFNLADKMMIRVIAKSTGVREETVKKEYKKIGDLGEVAREFKLKNLQLKIIKHETDLTVSEVYERLWELAKDSGAGSVERKIAKMAALTEELDDLGAKYVTRMPLGRLRLGFSDLTILDALSWMIKGDKSLKGEIQAAYEVQVDIGEIARILKSEGVAGLKKIQLKLGVPVSPALAQRLPTAEEMIEKMGKVAVEPKYDGTRLQVHMGLKPPDGSVRIFTRNLENVTQMFPDIAEALIKEVKAKEVILDGEGIGFDEKTGLFLPFQETIKRKRKHGIEATSKDIPLKYFVFDILYKDGRSLINIPLNQRRKILESVLRDTNRKIMLSPQIITESAKELRQYHDEQIEKGLEGVVIKKWEAPYDPGRRGFTWVKFKTEKGKKGAGLADTLDCVVMGYNRGRGKRANFGIGGFLVGVRSGENFVTISKIGTGLTDEQWREMRKRADKVKTRNQPKEYRVDKNMKPDVWCLPQIVTEIEADNITKSPIHTAGLAFRFPRLVRFRDDRSADKASTVAEAEKLYKMQK